MTALLISNLVKRFGGLAATNDLSFEVTEGQSVGLIGPNGAGKTTVFSQIMGELRQTEGTISLFGAEISAMTTPARIRAGVSRTYQVPRPFHELSVLENIRVGLAPNNVWKLVTRRPDRDREIEIARDVGLHEEDLNRTPAELSMGDLRKLEFARTLATGSRVMLLDEVFAGLTVGEIHVMSDLIQKLRSEGMTFVIVSHDLKALEPLVDSVIAIEQGRKIAEGRYREVMDHPEVRASYLGGGEGNA